MPFDAGITETQQNVMQLIECIKSEKYPFDMRETAVAECGTPGCIAGHAAAINPALREGMTWDVFPVGKWLGMAPEQAVEAFFPAEGIWRALEGITREHALAMLRHYLVTGEVDWEKAMADG